MSKKISLVLSLAGLCAVSSALAMGGKPKAGDEEAVNARIQPVAKVRLGAAGPADASKGNRSGEEIYQAFCTACHATGAAGAPKSGNKADWAPRIGVGLEVLTKTSIAGKGAMPPRGGSDATDEELVRAIVYMANKAGANFKEPAAGAKPASGKNPEEVAKTACFKCHETGEQGAPKLSDRAAWTQRASKGLDAVTTTVIRGHGKMPARGGLADLTDDELKKVIALMFKEVGTEAK